MAFREYTIGSRLFGVALGSSMMITLYMPSMDIAAVGATEIALDKQLWAGRETGWNLDDPGMTGRKGRPIKVILRQDPAKGAEAKFEKPVEAYVFEAGSPFPSGILHPRVLGKGVEDLSRSVGRIGEANRAQGAVFTIQKGMFEGKEYPYIENATAVKGWRPDQVLSVVADQDQIYAGAGKTMFVREGCWWCHTLLPEQTQDWQSFGAPPMLGDFQGESPTAFGSDRKAPDLLHVASRNSSREWMMLHFFNPRLVQPHSIMPRFDYLWGKYDANGKEIDFAKWRKEYKEYRAGQLVTPPEVPSYAKDSEIRYLIDFVLSLK